MREPGHYYVTCGRQERIVLWDGVHWWLTGLDYPIANFSEIGPRVPSREAFDQLLQACKAMLTMAPDMAEASGMTHIRERAKVAIAKAEGTVE